MDEQLKMYHWLLEQKGETVSGAIYNMLRKVKRTASAKPPFYMRETLHHNETELRSYWKRLYGVLSNMVSARRELDKPGSDHHIIVYPTPTPTCAWDCEFRAACPLFDDGSHVEGLLESAYRVHNPYERYTKEPTL
jgi:hypothetical protein